MNVKIAEAIAVFIVIILPICAIIGGIFGIAYGVDKYSCYKTAQKLNYKYDYSIWTGCILDDGQHKFLLEQLREIKGANQ